MMALVDSSKEEEDVPNEEEKEEEGAAERTKIEKIKEMGSLASAELTFLSSLYPLSLLVYPKISFLYMP